MSSDKTIQFDNDFNPKKIDPQLTHRDHESFYNYLCEFRNDLLTANFIGYKVVTNEKDTIESFSVHEAVKEFCDIELSNQMMESTLSITSFLELLKKMCILLYNMTDNRFFKSGFRNVTAGLAYILMNNWLSLVKQSDSLSKLQFLMSILHDNITWKSSIKSNKCLICGLNDTNFVKKHVETLNYAAVLSGIKRKCNSCESYFHLDCVLKHKDASVPDKEEEEEEVEKDEEKVEMSLVQLEERKFDLVKKYYPPQYICFNCDKSIKIKQAKQKSKRQKKELNSIEINNKQLRLNRARINYLEKKNSKVETSGDEDSESQEEDPSYQDKSKRRHASSSEEDSDPSYYDSESKKTRNNKKKRLDDFVVSDSNEEEEEELAFGGNGEDDEYKPRVSSDRNTRRTSSKRKKCDSSPESTAASVGIRWSLRKRNNNVKYKNDDDDDEDEDQ